MGLQELRQRIKKSLKFKEKIPQDDLVEEVVNIESDAYLPTELWLKVLSDLDKEDCAALSVTCRALRWMCLPKLFEHQEFYPFTSTIKFRRLRRTAYVNRAFDRLVFLCTPRIAPCIKDISLAPYPTGHALGRRGDPHIPENEIVDRILGALPTFTNLKSLFLQGIRASPSRFEVIRGLSLDHLTLETRADDISWYGDDPDCELPAPIPASQSFTLNRIENVRHARGEGIIPLDFLTPSSLVSIVAAMNGTSSIITALATSQIIFSSLGLLEISVHFIAMPDFITALSRCPMLQTLRLRSEATDSASKRIPSISYIPRDIIPKLNVYHGPPPLARYFINGRPIREAVLWSSRTPPSVLDSDRLCAIIPSLGATVTHLELGTTNVTTRLVDTVQNDLPRLSSLSVNTHLSSFHPGVPIREVKTVNITTKLSFGLPQLDQLAIGIQIPGNLCAGSAEEAEHLESVLRGFPEQYSPLSWQDWSSEEPWCKLIWQRVKDQEGEDVGNVFVERVTYERPYLFEDPL